MDFIYKNSQVITENASLKTKTLYLTGTWISYLNFQLIIPHVIWSLYLEFRDYDSFQQKQT